MDEERSSVATFASRLPELVVGLAVAGWAVLWMVRTGERSAFYLGAGQAFLWLYLVPIPHELGHALGARLAGGRVRRIRIGSGPLLASVRLGRVPLELRLRLGGHSFVDDVLEGRRLFRLRNLVVILAGPGANLLLATGAWLAGGRTLFPAEPPGVGLVGAGVWHAFLVANLGLAVASLRPWTMVEEYGDYPSDGRQVLDTLSWTEADVEAALAEAAEDRAGPP